MFKGFSEEKVTGQSEDTVEEQEQVYILDTDFYDDWKDWPETLH